MKTQLRSVYNVSGRLYFLAKFILNLNYNVLDHLEKYLRNENADIKRRKTDNNIKTKKTIYERTEAGASTSNCTDSDLIKEKKSSKNLLQKKMTELKDAYEFTDD